MKVWNDTIIRIFSLARSGHNAIMQWMAAQAATEEKPCVGTSIRFFDQPFYRLSRLIPDTNSVRPVGGEKNLGKYVRSNKKKRLIMAYEKEPLWEYDEDRLANNIIQCGRANKVVEMSIIRDPYNTFASILRWRLDHHGPMVWDWKHDLNRWRSYALEAVGKTQYVKGLIPIKYNNWHSSKKYRQWVAEQAGIPFTDAGRETVMGNAGGSSFDKGKYDGKAGKMDTSMRWKTMKEYEFYRHLVHWDWMADLSKTLFKKDAGVMEAIKEFHK